MSTASADADAAGASGTGDPLFFSGGGGDSECSTPFVSAPSSPSRDRDFLHAACFYSAPASPTRGGVGGGAGAGLLDFDFDFSSRFPSPSAAAMSSADELFCNGQIRPVRLAAALLHPQPPLAGDASPLDFDKPGCAGAEGDGGGGGDAVSDERGRVRGRSVRRKARSMSPFRTHWRRSPAPPAPQTPEAEPAAEAPSAAVTPAASRSSSSSSTASSASSASSSSSSRTGGSRRWGGFLKDLLHRSKSDGGKTHHHQSSLHATQTSPSPGAAPKRSPSPSPSPATRSTGSTGQRGGRRRSAHERLYEARRAEAEEMRRRTYLPYRQGFLLFGCIGLGNRSSGYGGAVHGLARGLNAAAAVSSRS
ncbi:unnamed protein product [Urochloa humidicola]